MFGGFAYSCVFPATRLGRGKLLIWLAGVLGVLIPLFSIGASLGLFGEALTTQAGWGSYVLFALMMSAGCRLIWLASSGSCDKG